MAILQDQSKPTYDQLLEMIAAQQKLLAERNNRGITFRINDWKAGDLDTQGKPREKDGARGITITGINRNGVTAYAGEWLKIIDLAPKLREFIEANRSKLSWKE